MASFPAQLALSAVIMGGVVTGLYFVGQSSPFTRAPAPATSQSLPRPRASAKSARSLLPGRAWVVIDFDGRLTGASPFSESKGPCEKVPAPPRVGLSIVAGKAPDEGQTLVLVSPSVTPEFWRCVRAEVLAAGGRELASEPGEESLESPSGVLVHRADQLLFASERGFYGELVELARGQAEDAGGSGPHASLAASFPSPAGSDPGHAPPLLATLHVPPDWLAGVGPEAAQTPLRHLVGGALRADADGGAQGTLECLEPGCDELTAFLLRARSDLGSSLPAPLGEAGLRSWTASREPQKDPSRGRIRLRWVPAGTSFADWVSGLWSVALQRGSGEAGKK